MATADTSTTTPTTEKTAGEQIADAIWKFNGGSLDQRQLALVIDTALKVYR